MNQKRINDPVFVTGNRIGGTIDMDIIDEEKSNIIVRQGNRNALLFGDIQLLISTGLSVGDKMQPVRGIKNGKVIFRDWRIVTKESFTPFDPNYPELHIKNKNGSQCTKDGKTIYTISYLTYKEDEFDEIISED